MIDINLIRKNPGPIRENSKNRRYDLKPIEEVIALDKKWRSLKKKNDALREERNKISQEINKLKKKREEKKTALSIKKAKSILEKLDKNKKKEKDFRDNMDSFLAIIPNLQSEDVPKGDETKNKEVKKWGKIPKFKFTIKSHKELLQGLNLLDMERAAKIAGSGFYILNGLLATMERALIQFMLDFHVGAGFLEVNLPQLVNKTTAFGTGNLPKFEEDLYKTNEGLYLIPTAEVPLTNLYSNETLEESELPKKLIAFTQCYRTEAGKHGSETPGIFRLHQFEKVEMVYLCKQEDSWKFLEEMTRRAEKILEMLKLPYRKVILSTGDSSFASAKTYDLEVWSPFMKKYLETSSCSNCTDFQARRMDTKYRTREGVKLVHTLNGSGLATPRLLIALVENYQQKDGSIKIPKVLQKYMGGIKKISP